MIDKITLSDNDIISMDESTGNIVISVAKLPEYQDRAEKDSIKVHYVEDPENIEHEYKIRDFDIDNATVMLDWVQQLGESVLTEAPNFAKSISKGINHRNNFNDAAKDKAEKAAKKFDKKLMSTASKLLRRDMSEEGQPWLFYIPKNGVYDWANPIDQAAAEELYRDMGNNVDPDIFNAIVTLPGEGKKQFIVRRGLEDFFKSGTTLTKATAKLDSRYMIPYKSEDFDLVDETPTEETTKEEPAKTVETSTTETPRGFSDKILKRFTGLAVAGDMEITDKSGNPVKLDFKTPITNDQVSEYRIRSAHGTMSLKGWLTSAVNNNLITESYNVDVKTLLESPVIKFDDADIMNPSEINFQKKIQKAMDDERKEAEIAKIRETEAKLKEKYQHVPQKINKSVSEGRTPLEVLDIIFDDIVPATGAADTKAGEIVRAIMRILYRDNNDGDKFFESYGIETCGGSAEYLFDNGFAEDIQNILDRAEYLADDDDAYSDAITLVAEHVVDKLREDNSLMWTANIEDSRDYSTEYIEENQPRYEYELYGSDDIITLVDNDVLTSWDLNAYVDNILSYESVYDGAKASRPWGHHDTSVTVENLTRDGYEFLKDSFSRDPEQWWADLVAEHADELTSNYDDEYSDDGSYTDEE